MRGNRMSMHSRIYIKSGKWDIDEKIKLTRISQPVITLTPRLITYLLST